MLSNSFLVGFRNLLVCVVIALIVGVCSILLGKPLQNLAYQWPICGKLSKEKYGFHELDKWF